MPIMYRTETYSGSRERRFDYVLQFEVFELGNCHILEELVQNGLVSRQDLVKQIQDIASEWEKNGYVDDMPEDDQLEFIEQLRIEISMRLNQDIQFALWLTDRQYVQDFYQGTDSDTEGYETSDVILSNLGNDGILFGYECEPYPIEC